MICLLVCLGHGNFFCRFGPGFLVLVVWFFGLNEEHSRVSDSSSSFILARAASAFLLAALSGGGGDIGLNDGDREDGEGGVGSC